MIYFFVTCLILAFLIWLFPLYVVEGESMTPTIKPKKFLLGCRLFLLEPQKIYVFICPVNKLTYIKRLDHRARSIANGGEMVYFFEGDNKNGSFDSRHFGYVREKDICSRIIWPRYPTNIEKGKQEHE